jgi:hypothetical protein
VVSLKFYATKNVETKKILAILQVKAEQKRPDIVYMLNTLDKTGLAMGERMNYTEYLRYLGLASNGQLTPEGAKAVKSGLVMIPEYGIYELSYVDEPTLPDMQDGHIVIDFKPVEAKSREIQGNVDDFNEYMNLDDKTYKTWKKGGQKKFHLRFERKNNNKPKIIKKPDTRASVELSFNTETGNVSWKFSSQEHEYAIKNYPAIDVYQNVKKMVKNWDEEHKAHIVSFNEVRDNPNKIRDFKETQHAQDFQLEYDFGRDYAAYRITVDDVDLLPRTIDDAREWTYQLMLMRIGKDGGYHTIRNIMDTLGKIIEEKPLRKRHPALNVGWEYVEGKLGTSTNTEDKNLFRSIRAAEDLTPEAGI